MISFAIVLEAAGTNGSEKHLLESTNVVYEFTCKDCKRVYIGTTEQKLKTRKSQHEGDVRNNKSDRSALARHAIANNHNFDFEKPRILECEYNYRNP